MRGGSSKLQFATQNRLCVRTSWLTIIALAAALQCDTIAAQSQAKIHIPQPQPQPLEEIVVTADLKERPLLSVPSSIGIVSEALIKKRAAKHIEDVLQRLPNVQITGGTSRARFYQIRGIGERDQYASPLNSSVGLLIDDVDFSGAGAAATLFDVDQVEVLRGPQGTRYGTGAVAGLINLRSNAPTPAYEGYIEQEFANYKGFTTGVAYGGPIASERLQFRIALQHNEGDGFIHNEHLDRSNTSSYKELSFRSQLRWLLNEKARIDFRLGIVDVDNGYDDFSLDNNRTTQSNAPGRDKQQSVFGGARLDWALGFAHLTGVINYADTAIDYGYDEDWTHEDFHPDAYISTDRYRRDRKNLSLEARLYHALPHATLDDDDAGGGLRLGWLAGLYVYDKEVELLRNNTLISGPFASRYDTEQIALYGELDFGLRSDLTLSLGGRIEAWKADYNDSESTRFNPKQTLWGGHLTLQWQPQSATYLYAKIARATKAGGFNIDGSLPEANRTYGSEALYNFELGFRRHWPNKGVQTEVAVFHMERDDVQIASSVAVPHPEQAGASSFIEFVDNAASGSNTGMEISTSWAPNAHWSIAWQIGLLHTRYRHYRNAAGDTLSGRDQALAPNWQANVVVQRHWGDWTLRYERQARDGYYFSDSHDQRARAAQLNHIWLGVEKGRWEIAAWIRNFTNQAVQTRGFFFGNDPRAGYEEGLYYQLGEPRRFGVTLKLGLGAQPAL